MEKGVAGHTIDRIPLRHRSRLARARGPRRSHMSIRALLRGQTRRAGIVLLAGLALVAGACQATASPSPSASGATGGTASTGGQFCKGTKLVFFPGGTQGGGFETVVYNGAKAAQ